MENLTGVARKHPQSEYSRQQNSLHQECAFVQQVTPGIGNALGPAEKAMQDTFMPALFE